MPQPYYVINAFTTESFGGNPAAIVPLSEDKPTEWMQAVATQMNLSETAFVDVREQTGPKSLRWFTPAHEEDLCGHATLATAHLLGGTQHFMTRSGELICEVNGDWIEMDFPADPVEPTVVPADVLRAIPVDVNEAARGRFDYILELKTAAELRDYVPDLPAIEALDCRGVILTAPGDSDGIDFVSRCFYPAVGEDPVTGSAHCTLAYWWGKQLKKEELTGEQASKRGGHVRMRNAGDRVRLAGRAVSVMKGELFV